MIIDGIVEDIMSKNSNNKTRDVDDKMGVGIAIGAGAGVALGVIFGVALGNVAFLGAGIAIGMGMGVGIGTAMNARNKK